MKIETKNIIGQIIKEDRFKDLLRECLAQKISEEYHFEDPEGFLIKKEVRDLLRKEIATMINEMVTEYYEMHSIKIMIEKEIKSINRNEILELLKGKFI